MKTLFAMLIIIVMASASCSKEDEPTATSPNSAAMSPGYYQASFSVDGAAREWKDGLNAIYSQPGGYNNARIYYGDTTITLTPKGWDTTITKWVTIHSSYNFGFNQKGGSEKIIIQTDTLTYTDSINASRTYLPYDLFKGSTGGIVKAFSGNNGLKLIYKDRAGQVWVSQPGSLTLSFVPENYKSTDNGNGMVLYHLSAQATVSDGTSTKVVKINRMNGFIMNQP